MKALIATLISTTVLVSGCASIGDSSSLSEYCRQNRAVCVLAGLVIAGGVILIASNNDSDGGGGSGGGSGGAAGGGSPGGGTGGNVGNASDIQLKEDIRHLTTLENGLRIYAFRYRGDPRYFTGVLAQEIIANPEFAHVVSRGPHGFLTVDYAQLGLEIHNAKAIRSASNKAIERAS